MLGLESLGNKYNLNAMAPLAISTQLSTSGLFFLHRVSSFQMLQLLPIPLQEFLPLPQVLYGTGCFK